MPPVHLNTASTPGTRSASRGALPPEPSALSAANASGLHGEGPPVGGEIERTGRILLEEGLLSPGKLARARRILSRLETPKPLSAVVVDLGWVSKPELEAVLKRHRRELPVEDILVEKGLVNPEQLAAATAAVAAQPGATVARHLVSLGAVSERVYLEAYCEKHDLPLVEPDPSLVDAALLKKANHRYLTRVQVLPLSIHDGRLNVLVDSLDRAPAFAELERLYGVPVSPSIGSSTGIRETLAALAPEAGEPQTARRQTIKYHQISDSTEESRAASEIVDHLIRRALLDGASDIHVEPSQTKVRVRFRIDGGLVHVTDYPAAYASGLISRIKVLAQADIAERRIHQDGRIYVQNSGEEIDLRASFYVTVFGENAVLRVLRKSRALVGLSEMGMSGATLATFLDDVLAPSTGVVLVTGPTGSGKTTTLYAAVNHLNDSTKKIITCEDPVEYVIDGIAQCSVANRPGITFADSLRAMVRQDPDIILVGEIRDRVSAEMVVEAALTGHKVLSTFHTEDAVGALVRLTEMNVEPFLIASTVTAVLAQRLVRRCCPQCAAVYTPSSFEMRALSLNRDELVPFSLTKGIGCPSCYYAGYRGRTGLYELLVIDDAMREAILQRRPAHELRKLAFESPAFVCLQEDGIAKALRGDTTLSEVAENTPRSKIVRPLHHLVGMYQ